MIEALQRLHQVGFCHWDIKLDNICFENGRYFLIDFAFAQRINRRNPIHTFKGNSMFASMRKFNMNPRASPVDDIESLLYLVCFCMDGFYLPWLHDYINQVCTDHFIQSRVQRARKSHQYLYEQMPGPVSKSLRYIHMLNDRITAEERKQYSKSMSQSSQYSFDMNFKYSQELSVDYDYLKGQFRDLIDYY